MRIIILLLHLTSQLNKLSQPIFMQVGSLDSLDIYDDRAVGGSHHSPRSPSGSNMESIDRLNSILQRSSSQASQDSEDMSGRGLYRHQRPPIIATKPPSLSDVADSSGLSTPTSSSPTNAPKTNFRFDTGHLTAQISGKGATAYHPYSINVSVPAVGGRPGPYSAGGRSHGSSLYKNAVLNGQSVSSLMPVKEQISQNIMNPSHTSVYLALDMGPPFISFYFESSYLQIFLNIILSFHPYTSSLTLLSQPGCVPSYHFCACMMLIPFCTYYKVSVT